ncbi:Uncharacterised protein [uncultured archaeon]|nr:Uncharacterised protein [uncultured archaeon]
MKIKYEGKGHENVRSTHKMTLEFTKDGHLTPRGDCIVAVSFPIGCAQLPPEFKKLLSNDNAALRIRISCGGETDEIHAQGSKELKLTHPTDIVIRKSTFIDDRTLAINANKAASDLKKALVENLKKNIPVEVEFEVRHSAMEEERHLPLDFLENP